jgi:hypothetical protein
VVLHLLTKCKQSKLTVRLDAPPPATAVVSGSGTASHPSLQRPFQLSGQPSHHSPRSQQIQARLLPTTFIVRALTRLPTKRTPQQPLCRRNVLFRTFSRAFWETAFECGINRTRLEVFKRACAKSALRGSRSRLVPLAYTLLSFSGLPFFGRQDFSRGISKGLPQSLRDERPKGKRW